MNSNYERKSAADLREKQKQMIAQAEAVQKTVAVTEPNWQALIVSLRMVVETEAQILEKLGVMANREDVMVAMENLSLNLELHSANLAQTVLQYEHGITGAAQTAEESITESMEKTQKKMVYE